MVYSNHHTKFHLNPYLLAVVLVSEYSQQLLFTIANRATVILRELFVLIRNLSECRKWTARPKVNIMMDIEVVWLVS